MTAEAPGVRTASALWRALVRFEPEKIVPEIAVRNTIGFTCAVILGTFFASPSTGVVAGLGALNAAYSDGRDPYALRARRMLISALLSGVAVMLGALSGHSNVVAVMVAALWAFGAGMLVALGTTPADLGVITLVTLVVFAAKPLPPVQALEAGAVALGGGLLQTLLSTFLWPIRRYEPERRIISEIYTCLSRIARSPTQAAHAPPMTKQISDAQEALAPLARDHSMEAERHVFLLAQAERIRLSVLNAGRLLRRIARHEGGETAARGIAAILGHAADAIQLIGQRVLQGESPGATPVTNEPLEKLTASLVEFQTVTPLAGNAFFAALLRDARHQADALRSQIRTATSAASSDGARTFRAGVGSASENDGENEPWRLHFEGWRARVVANLSIDSTVFRHAVRLAICLAAGDAIGRGLSLQRTYWIPMTIAIVLKPDFTSTFSRGVLRISGTLAGLVIATVVFRFVHTGVATDIALMAFFTFLLRLAGPANYGIFVAAVSAFVVLMIAVTGVAPDSVIVPRALNTALGGALALLAYAVWPTWERTQTRTVLADMLDAYRAYFRAVAGGYLGEPLTAIDRVRVKGRRARSNAVASVDRMSGEPGVTAAQVSALSAILVHSHNFVHAAMAMEARLYRHRRDPAPAWMQGFSISVDRTLLAMAETLRHPPGSAVTTGTRRSRMVEIATPAPGSGDNLLLETEADRIRTSLRSLGEELDKRGWR